MSNKQQSRLAASCRYRRFVGVARIVYFYSQILLKIWLNFIRERDDCFTEAERVVKESTLFCAIQLKANQLKSIDSSMEFFLPLPSTEFRRGERKAESLAGRESSNGSTFFVSPCIVFHYIWMKRLIGSKSRWTANRIVADEGRGRMRSAAAPPQIWISLSRVVLFINGCRSRRWLCHLITALTAAQSRWFDPGHEFHFFKWKLNCTTVEWP